MQTYNIFSFDNKPTLTFDDVQIVPCDEPCTVEHRADCDISSDLVRRDLRIANPLIASPMDSVCGVEMCIEMSKNGGIGVLHRFNKSIEEHKAEIVEISKYTGTIASAIGVTGDYLERAQELVSAGCTTLFLDTAHGNHVNTRRAMSNIKKSMDVNLVPGNVAHQAAVKNLIDWGADAIRVGIGGGSVCTTRRETGVGVPMVSSIIDVCQVASAHNISVIADGGIRSAGDVAKAIACGADTVMIGSMFAGTQESPGDVYQDEKMYMYKVYRGSASFEAKRARGEYKNVEGETMRVPYRGPVSRVIGRLEDGLRSAMAYTNAKTIIQYQAKARLVRITQPGLIESHPHGKI